MRGIYAIMFLMACNLLVRGQQHEQPTVKMSLDADTFYTTYRVEDKYRWLEDIHSPDSKDWLSAQNKLYKSYLLKVSNKTSSFNAIDTYTHTEYDNPKKMGNYYFSKAYYNAFGASALYSQSTLKEYPQILVDPVFISVKDQILIGDYSVSKDSKLLAYQFSRNGSDWREVKVINIQNGMNLKDHLKGLKFSSLEWLGNGFFYSTFSRDEQFGETRGQRVFYHTIGTEQQDDKLIFEKNGNADAYFFLFSRMKTNRPENRTSFISIISRNNLK